jgi:glycine cleavage system H protein
LLIPFWLLLNKKASIPSRIRKALGILTAGALKIPQGILYHPNHTWAYLDMSGTARVGLDDLLLHITGDVRFHHLKKPGDKIKKGDLLSEIEHDGKSLRIFSPLSGEIVDTNAVLTDNPGLLHEDPYLRGWMYQVRPTRWIAETSSCYLAEDATNWFANELDRFKLFLSGTAGSFSPDNSRMVLQDGGELTDHPLSNLPVEVWNNFQQDFLNQIDASR